MRKLPLLLFFLLPGFLVADIVYLKGGGKFSGRILEQNEEEILIDVGDGTVGFGMDRVERIVKGPSPLDEYDARASKLAPQDVNGWRSLAQWAATKGLAVQSRAAYHKVLAVAPDDPEAREAMGFVQVNGRWLTEEESYRARGFVKYQGEWLTPAELQLVQADAAKEQARDDAAKKVSDAEYAASMDRLRAEEEKRAKQSEDFKGWNDDPVYWGGVGYGVTSWPNTGAGANRPVVSPR